MNIIGVLWMLNQIIVCQYNIPMFGDKLSVVRQSLEMRASGGAKSHATRDSAKADLPQYSIDVELSENNKQMLEAFKQSSGYYNTSPKKQKNASPSKKPPELMSKSIPEPPSSECPRIYLFGNKDGDYLTKQEKENEVRQLPEDSKYTSLKLTNCQTIMQSTTMLANRNHEEFLKEILETLGMISSNQKKRQIGQIIEPAYNKYVDMKSSGRWDLIQQYFRTPHDDDLNYSCVSIPTKSIMKKKSLLDTQGQKKKVKVVEPESASQLIRTKYKLAEELQSHLQKLTKGFKFQKYCYNSEKVEEIFVYLSYDLKCLAWQPKGKQPIVENMLGYNGITDGARSKNYTKYVGKCQFDEQLAFSIIFKNRTLDLLAATLEQKQQFVEAMKFVKSLV